MPDDINAVMQSPAFRQLTQQRSSFAWILSAIMLVVYLGFIFLVAFAHDLMAAKVDGSNISVGILLGLAVIVFAFILTGIYVGRANGRFDDLTHELTKGPRQ